MRRSCFGTYTCCTARFQCCFIFISRYFFFFLYFLFLFFGRGGVGSSTGRWRWARVVVERTKTSSRVPTEDNNTGSTRGLRHRAHGYERSRREQSTACARAIFRYRSLKSQPNRTDFSSVRTINRLNLERKLTEKLNSVRNERHVHWILLINNSFTFSLSLEGIDDELNWEINRHR